MRNSSSVVWILICGLVLAVASLPFGPLAASADPTPHVDPTTDDVAELLGDRFGRQTSRHFIIFSDADPARSRAKAALVDRTHHQLRRCMRHMSIATHDPDRQLIGILFQRHAEYQRFAARHDRIHDAWIGGYYANRNNWIVFYDDADAPAIRDAMNSLEEARSQVDALRDRSFEAARAGRSNIATDYRTRAEALDRRLQHEEDRLRSVVADSSVEKTIHEATHLLAYNTGVQSRYHEYPFWFTEGLATNFETATPSGAFGPDVDHVSRREEFEAFRRGNQLMPLRRFVTLTHVDHEDHADVMYHEAYALFSYLYRHRRSELAEYIRAVPDLQPGRFSAAEQLAIFERHFGPAEQLEATWLRYEAGR